MKKLLLLILVSLGLFSCRKETPEPTTAPEKMEELTVPAGFSWKTTKSFQLELTGSTAGIATVANTAGIPYQKAYLSANLPFMMKVTVPSYEQQVRLLFDGKDVPLALTGENLNYRFQ